MNQDEKKKKKKIIIQVGNIFTSSTGPEPEPKTTTKQLGMWIWMTTKIQRNKEKISSSSLNFLLLWFCLFQPSIVTPVQSIHGSILYPTLSNSSHKTPRTHARNATQRNVRQKSGNHPTTTVLFVDNWVGFHPPNKRTICPCVPFLARFV